MTSAAHTLQHPHFQNTAVLQEVKVLSEKANPNRVELKRPSLLQHSHSLRKMHDKINKELNLTDRRNIRLKNFDFTQKIDQEFKNRPLSSIIKEVQTKENTFLANEEKVQSNLDCQQRRIREKIEERRKNSFIKSRTQLHTTPQESLAEGTSKLSHAPTALSRQNTQQPISFAKLLDELDEKENGPHQ